MAKKPTNNNYSELQPKAGAKDPKRLFSLAEFEALKSFIEEINDLVRDDLADGITPDLVGSYGRHNGSPVVLDLLRDGKLRPLKDYAPAVKAWATPASIKPLCDAVRAARRANGGNRLDPEWGEAFLKALGGSSDVSSRAGEMELRAAFKEGAITLEEYRTRLAEMRAANNKAYKPK